MRIGLAYNEKPESASTEEHDSNNDAFAEWDDPSTIAAVEQALGLFGSVIRLEADQFFPQNLALARPDLVFNMAEGLHGQSREALVPAICEYLTVPYTGSDPLTLALSLHKGRTKETLAYRGVPTAPFLCVDGYEAKWVWDRPDAPLAIFQCPAPVPAALYREVERTALDAYHALGCRDWCRVDLRVDRFGVPNILELNPLPGILPDPAMNSCFPKAARAAGFGYDELIQEVVRIAWRRVAGRDVPLEGRGRGVVGAQHAAPLPAAAASA